MARASADVAMSPACVSQRTLRKTPEGTCWLSMPIFARLTTTLFSWTSAATNTLVWAARRHTPCRRSSKDGLGLSRMRRVANPKSPRHSLSTLLNCWLRKASLRVIKQPVRGRHPLC